MTPKVGRTDNTRNQRQARRREREKQWLTENGWHSWEALHTALINSSACLVSGIPDATHAPVEYNNAVSDSGKVIKYQWMRNAEGGQEFGNRQEIRLLTEDSFQRFVFPRLRPNLAGTLSDYLSKFPGNTHYAVIWHDGDSDWQFIGVGSQEELESEPRRSPWAVEVQDFQSGMAISFGKIADGEVKNV